MLLGRSLHVLFALNAALSLSLISSSRRRLSSLQSLMSTSANSKGASLDRAVEYSFSDGFEHVIGVDEAGRGPLAGPVVVAACFVPRDLSGDLDAIIQDSKKMTEEQRERGYAVLLAEPRIKYAVSVVSHLEIDELNILQASLTGMRRSTVDLLEILQKDLSNGRKVGKSKVRNESSAFNSSQYIALVDGNKEPADMPIECKAIVKGDSRVFSIAAASIIAKVVRDHIMVDLHKEYPQYNFAQHKGYPTAAHRALLMEFGPCPYHRRSYGPVKLALEAMERRNQKRTVEEVNFSPDEDTEIEPSKKRRTKSSKFIVGPTKAKESNATISLTKSRKVSDNKQTVQMKATKIASTKEKSSLKGDSAAEIVNVRRSLRIKEQK